MNFSINPRRRLRCTLPGSRIPGQRKTAPVISVAARLRNREVFGRCKKTTRSEGSSRKAFDVLPRRFAFPITSLVDEVALQEDAHVFLGFSSCDRFLISYTEKIEEARHTGFLSHVYTLYWWLWSPGRKAKKVANARLFANEEIEYSLYLCYAEWPTLKSQIVVYGWRKFCDSCYITITTVPTLTHCKQCDALRSITADNPEEEGEGDLGSNALCVKHGYTMHFKQASGASQAGVLNTSGLKIDGVLVLNIGHSIAVLSTGHLPQHTDLENLPLSSIKRRACEGAVIYDDIAEVAEEQSINHGLSTSDCSSSSHSIHTGVASSASESGDSINWQHLLVPEDGHSRNVISREKLSVYDLDGIEYDTCVQISLNQSKYKLQRDKENIADGSHCEQLECEVSLSADPYFDPEPKSIVLRAPREESARVGVLEERTCRKCGCLIVSCCQKSVSELHKAGAKICSCAMHVGEHDASAKTAGDFSSASRLKSSFLSPSLGTSVLNERQNAPDVFRSELNFVTPSPTASDSSSSVQFSGDYGLSSAVVKSGASVRHSDGLVSFSENFYGPINQENITPDHPLPVGETSLDYCSMFCQGAGGGMLHPLEKGDSSIQAFSQHLVLDLEHVIFDILRTRCYAVYKFGYLVDYEANIMDLCGSTRSVLIHVVALLNMQRNRSMPPLGATEKAPASSQQAEFILSWSLTTGRYELVVARPLQSYDERKSGEWKGDWIVRADTTVKQQCAVQTDPYKSVYILDNLAVLRDRSLKGFWNCDQTLAIRK